MGEFAKKWVAAIFVALILVIIAAISIGKMDRNGTTAPPQTVVAQKTAPVRPATSPRTPDQSEHAAVPSSVNPATMRNDSVNPLATPKKAFEKVPSAALVHKRSTVTTSVPKNSAVNHTTSAPPSQQNPSQVQVAQQQQSGPVQPAPSTLQ